MRAKVQVILDTDWPDDTSGRYIHYGSHRKSIALVRVAMHAEDCGDDELYDQAVAQATIIDETDPDSKRKFVQVIFPQFHQIMHGKDQKLLIFREKHGTWYFTTNNATEFSMALLTVLEQRLKEGWYLDELYGDDLPKEDVDPDQTDMFKSNKVPKTDKVKAQAMIDLARSDKPGCVIKAGKAAYEFLQGRDDCQYEDFEIEYPSTIKFSLT